MTVDKGFMMNIGIIGAGIAGLAAALRLTKAGHQVTLYEGAPFLGGQASTFDVGGGRLEKGYHHLFTSDVDIIDLIEELGLTDRLAWIDSSVGIFHGGKIYDFITPKDLIKFKPLSLFSRIRLGLVTLYLRRYKNWRSLEKYTASEWIKKYAGAGAYNVVWGPLLRGKFGSYFDKVGMPWLWGKMHTRFASRGTGLKGMQSEKLGYPMGSFAEIFEDLERKITFAGGRINLSTPVRDILIENGQAKGVLIGDGDGKDVLEYHDKILSTTPSYIFDKLVPELPDHYSYKLKNVDYLSAILVILVLKRPFTNKYWLNIADRSIPFVGLIEQTNFVSPELYGGNKILYISNYLDENNPLFHFSESDLLEEYIPHLQKINPFFDKSWIEDWYYHKVSAAQPIIGKNYSERIPEHRTPIKNLYLANTTQIYPEDRGTNYSVRMGNLVADLILEDVDSNA